ncbi:MAG: hypothetical protein COT84_00010 [Chlamydiae bacterium CG10_big_fil_rev_8_21_14_0_10_35_9]|nr:MAG: hypothetical protein COT84_00010 [Chlamydiae bacterium CG10_big_fil_rev_8_21_14_0_10_35_9]
MKRMLLTLLFSTCLFANPLEVTHQLREKLQNSYEQALSLKESQADEKEYKELLAEINDIKTELSKAENLEKKNSSEMQDSWGFWDLGETTIGQLMMEYGSGDYLYIIPQELMNMKIQLYSMIKIDRSLWDEMLELILSQNGIGTRKLNSYAKQLYILKHDPSSIQAVVQNLEDLKLLKNNIRALYVFTPKIENLKSVQAFFERFSDPKQTTVQAVGAKIAIISNKQNLEKLLSIYHAVFESNSGKKIKLVNLRRLTPENAEKILKSFFTENTTKSRAAFYQNLAEEMQIMHISQGLVFIGEQSSVERAEKILKSLEDQLQDPKEMMVHWYQCKHADPEDVARMLEQVYDSLTFCRLDRADEENHSQGKGSSNAAGPNPPVNPVNVPMAEPGMVQGDKNKKFGNFIVDVKSGSIMMVIRSSELEKIEQLLKKLDTPKKMVEIEVILVEKKLQDRKQTGINLLKIGSASSTSKTGLSFDSDPTSPKKGILDFMLSRPKGKLPAFDLTFSLLLAQDDIQIHATPSVLATNQTPATISLVEEISINNGAVQLEGASSRGTLEKSFTRAQYGTTIVMTPMIHQVEDKGFVTLQTNITFDTTQMSRDDRPPVTRRHVENEVRIPDGETIIIGGLQRKTQESSQEKIPFLGDIPGIGKLFGTNKSNESNTEMFIFITPRILKDPMEEIRIQRRQEMLRRPGDLPDFLHKIEQAKKLEKKKMFEDSLNLLFDQFGT